MFDGQERWFSTETNIAKVKKYDIDNLKNTIIENKELIDFMLEYQEKVYKPLTKEKIEKYKEQKKEKEIIKNSIPKVGMTSEQVRQTKWGNPDKINKDTYSWGTNEQWVYKKYGYVYLENGIVVSVSER